MTKGDFPPFGPKFPAFRFGLRLSQRGADEMAPAGHDRQAITIMRRPTGTFAFALVGVALACGALLDVAVNGRLTLIDPRLLGILAIGGIAVLLGGIVKMRSHASDLSGR